METLFKDVKFGFRMLKKRPGFTLVAILTLALGIGANSAIFSVVNAVMLRPLPFKDPERLVMVWETSSERRINTSTPANFLDWREQNQVFEEMAAFAHVSFNLIGNGDPERINGTSVSTNFFHLLGVDPALGVGFDTESVRSGNWKVVVLSHDFWKRRFGGDTSLIGKQLALNDKSYTVIGIMPEQFKWPRISPSLTSATENSNFWVPAIRNDIPQLGNSTERDLSSSRNASYMRVLGRLKPGVKIDQAMTAMNIIAANLARQYPDTNTGRGINLIPLDRQIVGDLRSPLLLLLGAVGFVLAIACANVANLFLARASSRRKEFAVRVALGAGRLRLIRQLLTESMLLAVVSGGFGLLVSVWGVSFLIGLSPGDIPRLNEVTVDRNVLFFTLIASLLTGLLFGLLPAIQASRPDLNETLKDGGKMSVDSRNHSRNILVVAEVALSLVLLIGAGLLLKSFLLLQDVKPGFDPDNLLTFKLSLPETKYPTAEKQAAAFQTALKNIESIPGVKSVGATLTLPFAGDDIGFNMTIENRPEPPPGKRINVGYQVTTPGYFATMRIPLLKGRDFSEGDTRDNPGVAIINETLSRRHFQGEDPVGKRIQLGGSTTWLTIIGVVADVKHYSLSREPRAEAYVTYLQSPFSFMDIVVRAEENPLGLVSAVRSAIQRIDKDQPIANVHTMEELLSDSVANNRFLSLLVSIFGVIALLLAAVGIYGVISYSVAQRTHEIGIRMALGAGQMDILRLVLGRGMLLTVAGIGLGLIASLAVTQVISGLLFGIGAADPAVYIAIPLLLAGVALLATYLPARRATRIDPMVALRYE